MTHDERSKAPRLNQSRRSFLGQSAAMAGAAIALPAGISFSSSAGAQAPIALNFQLSWIKTMQYGGWFAGVEKGFFKEAGFDATFNTGGPNVDPIANVAAGRSVLGDRPSGPLVVAREKGIPVKVIGTVFQKNPFAIISLSSKPVRSIKELAGKSIEVSLSARPLIISALRDAGVDVKSVKILPATVDAATLVNGQIDAYCGYETNQGVMLTARGVATYVMNLHDILPETGGTIYAREDFLAGNKDLVVRFLRAGIKSWRWAMDNPDETVKLLVEKYGVPGLDPKAQLMELKATAPFIQAGIAQKQGLLSLDMGLFDNILDIYRKAELIKSNMKAADLCDPQYIIEAHRRA
jgi:NitT/TauT family transport system substrate-binding protein